MKGWFGRRDLMFVERSSSRELRSWYDTNRGLPPRFAGAASVLVNQGRARKGR